jgi:hypothetical protein
MKWDVKAVLTGLALLGTGSVALVVVPIWRTNPDSPSTALRSVLQWLALAAIIALLAGSLAIAGASISLSCRWAPAKLVRVGAAFLAVAAVMSGISRAFPSHTYAWVPVLMPWCAAIFSGAIMLLVAMLRWIHFVRARSG